MVRDIVDKKAAKNVANFNNECIKELKLLWKNKLTTSSEEKQAMDQSVSLLKTKIEADKKEKEKD
jgi:hypothetical protein